MGSTIRLLGLAAIAAALVLVRPASANLVELLGDWHNVDSKTRGLVRIVVAEAGGEIESMLGARATQRRATGAP
jgi:hypothetical protein